jgi:hypothetical protein
MARATAQKPHLGALEAGFHDEKLGGVDHERHARDLRVADEEVHKSGHGGHAIDQTVIHVDVEYVCALLYLHHRQPVLWHAVADGGAASSTWSPAKGRFFRGISSVIWVD